MWNFQQTLAKYASDHWVTILIVLLTLLIYRFVLSDSIVLSLFFVLSLYQKTVYISSISCLCFWFHECWIHEEHISRYWSRITSSSRKAHYTGSYFFKYTLWYTVFVLYTETLIDTHFSLFPWEMVFYVLFHSFLSLSNVVFIRNSLHKFNTEIVKAVSCLFVFILFFHLFIFYLFFFYKRPEPE